MVTTYRSALGAALLVSSLLACGGPAAQVRRGHAARGGTLRLVVLPASCSSVDDLCDDELASGMTGLVSSELEFAGHQVIDATTLVEQARTRGEASGELAVLGARVLEVKGRVQQGSVFQDLPPEARRALLQAARADGIVTTRVVVGARQGMSPKRENTVVIRLGMGDGGDLAWSTRCSVTSGFNPPISQAVDRAGRCALAAVVDK